MNIPKILLTIGGIVTAGLIVKNDVNNKLSNRPTAENDYIIKQKIEADGPPKHMSKNTDKN